MLRTNGDEASYKAKAIFNWLTEGFQAALADGHVHKVTALKRTRIIATDMSIQSICTKKDI